MTASRIEKIREMLESDPQDIFLRYSLAMEQEKIGEFEASEACFRELMKESYVPAFFMLAQHLTKRERVDDARTLLRDGIEHARQQDDAHAAGEMSEFLASLGDLGEANN